MYDWIDIELARQRREEMLREARERRISAAGRTAETSREPTASILRLLRSVWPRLTPVRNDGKAGAPIHECSAD